MFGQFYRMPKDAELLTIQIKFLNHADTQLLNNMFFVKKYLKEEYFNGKGTRARLIMGTKSVPTLFSETQDRLPKSLLPAVTKQCKPPILRPLQKDEQDKFEDLDRIGTFKLVNDSLLADLEPEFCSTKSEDHVL